MKQFLIITFSFLLSLSAKSQNITGQWNGVLKIQAIQLRVVFHISKSDTQYTATMDSPDQGAKGIPVDKVEFIDNKLALKLNAINIQFEGVLNTETNIIEGTFKQNGMSFPLNLSKEIIEKEANIRPQEPKEPFPYISENIIFENSKDQIKLAGTLTLPNKEGNFPAAILISGSGPQNRNEEVFGHKPFLVLSDYLTKNGIAVLRFDDRGIGESTGDFKAATSLDFAKDVESAITYLKTRKEINPNKIGLIGHSEGGIIAPMVASESKDVDYIVLLAGLGIPADELLMLQGELLGKAYGINDSVLKISKTISNETYNIVKQNDQTEMIKQKLSEYLNTVLSENPNFPLPGGIDKEAYITLQIETLSSPWMSYFLKINPEPILKKVKCPVLALNGEKDLQVPPQENLNGIKVSLEEVGNKNITIKELPDLNHLFQECKTGLPLEYSTLEQTFSPDAMKIVAEWILNITKK